MDGSSSSESKLRVRVRRQEVVADLGQRALETDDLDRLLREASTAVAETVGSEYCSILELRPDGDDALLRQGFGWPTELVGSATVALDGDTQPGYALDESPVVVDDRESEDRFSLAEVCADRGVDSSVSVVIGTDESDREDGAADGEPWGVLAAYATDPRAFTDRDVAFVRRVADVLEAAIDRRRRERRRRERERAQDPDRRRVVRALEAAREGISLLDENGEFIYVNDAYAETFRYEPEEMIGEHWDDLGIESNPDRFYDEIIPNIAAEGQWSGTTTCVRRDGSTFPSQHSLTHTDDGELICVVRDISDRQERERTLRETRTRLEVATEAASVGLWTWDIRNDVVTADGFVAESYGIDPATAAAGAPIDLFYDAIHEEDRERTIDRVEEALEETGELRAEYRVRNADGTVMWLVARGAVEYDDGTPVRMTGAISDITEQKRRERRLEALVDRLEESNRRLERFAYAASHDLQEPLRMVSSYLQLLERRYGESFDEEGREFLAFAVDGAERMRDMIDGLLAYSRVETGGSALEPVELDGVLADVRADLQVKIEETDAEIAVDALPRVAGDRGQLRQLFQNLLDNALEYSDEPPQVHVFADCSAPVDGRWEIAVRDEGIGIHPDDSDRIFEVFQRLHGRDEHDGTGIGLALCQRIVERHGGSIRVDSEPGDGATFTVALPAADSNETPESTSPGHF